jgi:hypothetical protein
MKAKKSVYQSGGKMPVGAKKKMTDMEIAKANRMQMLTEERNTIRKYDPDALAAFDRDLKTKGYMVNKKPVKKMMGGGTMDDMYSKGGKMEYGMGGKMKKYLAGGQVKLDKNKDGKISGEDFKMMKKYQAGGKIDKKKELLKGKGSAAYEARRAESRKQMEADANVVRRQEAINRASRMLDNPEAYKSQQQRAASPAYKTVSGQMQGISSAERAGASKGTVGTMTPTAAKRSEKNIKNPPVVEAPKRAPEPARKPGELSAETLRLIQLGFTPEANLRRAKMEDASMAANPRDWEVLAERAARKKAAAEAAKKKK